MSIFPISVTDLNKYRDFINQLNEKNAYDDAEFLRQLREGITETPIMKAGTLGHEAIEHAADGDDIDVIEKDGIVVRFKLPDDTEIEFMPQREEFIGKLYTIGDVSLHLRGKIDGAKPGTIVDYKFGGKFDAEKLADEYQWRAYLSIMGDEYWDVTYSHFTTREVWKKDMMKEGLSMDKVYFDVIEHNEVTFTRDEETEKELLKHALDFYEWSQRAGWQGRKPTPPRYMGKVPVADIDPATLER